MTNTTLTRCPDSIDGAHAIEWMTVPASVHYGDIATTHTDSYQRGFCWHCDERFTR